MNHTLFRLSFAVGITSFNALSNPITSGALTTSLIGQTSNTFINLSGPNFALSMSNSYLPPFSLPFGCLHSPTCTFAFSKTIDSSYSLTPPTSWSLTSNGSTYSGQGPAQFPNSYELRVNLAFSSLVVTVPATTEFDPITGFPTRTLAGWSDVPFSMTGSVEVTFFPPFADPLFPARRVVFSDTLSGSGLAGGFGEFSAIRADSSFLSYQFSSVPEPSTAALLGSSFLLCIGLVRRRRSIRNRL